MGLNLCGINTSGSCEGHGEHGTFAPYIDVHAIGVGELTEKLRHLSDEAQRKEILWEITRMNLEERKKLLPLLSEFYKGRKVRYETQLVVQDQARGWSRIESQGAGCQKIENEEEKRKKLQQYQEEMMAFTAFLKETYYTAKTDALG